jgi:HEAT repeat protein
MRPLLTRCLVAILTLTFAAFAVRAESAAEPYDEQLLRDAGLSADAPTLLAFFPARARTQIDAEPLHRLVHDFIDGSTEERGQAARQLVGLGPLALAATRQVANDFDHPEAAQRASRCLPWLDGPGSHKLLIAAARWLGQHHVEGAAAALLAYLPCADNAEVIAALQAALKLVAATKDKADAALLRGLSDRMGIRRAAAGVALCGAVPPEQVPQVRKLLKDPAPQVRLRAARALAEANDAEAIPVLIDLLAELPAGQRQAVEDQLKGLAGEWALTLEIPKDDEVSRGVRRDAWASWWRRTDGAMLLATLARHTLTPDKRRAAQQLVRQLGSEEFKLREDASRRLLEMGGVVVPLLSEAIKDRDAEVARRANLVLERIETGPDRRMPLAALRLLAVRKPPGAIEALLAYLPFAEDEMREEEVRKSLSVLARRDGKLDSALRNALADSSPKVRIVAAEVLLAAGGAEGRAALEKLLAEDIPSVRLRVALALMRAGQRTGISLVIDLLPVLSDPEASVAEEALFAVAGDAAPQMPEGAADDKKKRRAAWAAWWKLNAERVNPALPTEHVLLGYTLISDDKRLLEVDRRGKILWSLDTVKDPMDAWMLPGQRILVVEIGAKRVTERDRKGNILWEKADLPASPLNVQRLPNGNTFLTLDGGRILEVDRSGKEIYQFRRSDVAAAYRSRQGAIICLSQNGECLRLDTTGKQLSSFKLKYPIGQQSGFLDLLPNGRLLLTSRVANKVMEYDSQGKLLHEWDTPSVSAATGLPGGHILVSSSSGGRVFELDRAGNVVWEQRNLKPYRARRR